MYEVFAHNHDALRIVARADTFNDAWEQALAALNDWMAYSEVRRGDETLWDSRYGYAD